MSSDIAWPVSSLYGDRKGPIRWPYTLWQPELLQLKSLIIYSRLVPNRRSKFIANIILGALKSKEIIYARSV